MAKLRGALDCGGDVSLQNALSLALGTLSSAPPYGHREVIVLLASLCTCDPGAIVGAALPCPALPCFAHVPPT